MDSDHDPGLILVTGASGHIGNELSRALRACNRVFLPADIQADDAQGIVGCDLRLQDQVARLFESHPIQTVVHTAGILPTAFTSDPLQGAAVNLVGSVQLLQNALKAKVKRFVFASSMSVYGSLSSNRLVNEDDLTAPDHPYGASKRAIELIGNALAKSGLLEFVSLRIARVIGPGIKRTSSPWRAQIFEGASERRAISIPFAADARLSLVHVEDIARMLTILVSAPHVREHTYNTPAEMWAAGELKSIVEEFVDVRVNLADGGGGPICSGDRFIKEFGFRLRGLRARLAFFAPDSTPAQS